MKSVMLASKGCPPLVRVPQPRQFRMPGGPCGTRVEGMRHATSEVDVARPVSQIITAIEDFNSSNGDWLELDALFEELFHNRSASLGIDAMLHVFERHPTEDGAGVFWSIVHGLESLPGYESRLVESVRKAPSVFALLMVNRLLNAGCQEGGGVRFASLLEQVVKNQNANPEVKLKAQEILDKHEA